MRFGPVCKFCDYNILHLNKTRSQYKCEKCNKRFKYTISRELKKDEYFILEQNSSKEYKKEIFSYLFVDNKMKILNENINKINIDHVFERFKIFNEYKNNLQIEELIKFLLEIDNTCRNKDCNNKTSFRRAGHIDQNNENYNNRSKSFDVFCSKECLHNHRSQIMTNNNAVHKIKDIISWKKNMSESTIKAIQNGTFTPNITNSWCRSKLKINNNFYRSSWDAFFHLVNNHLEYEKIRIPYKYKNQQHIYIVDFVDVKNKILYEIKPYSEKEKKKNILKEKYAIKWCLKNDYTYETISDNWFKSNYFNYKYLLNDYPDVQRKLKQFE